MEKIADALVKDGRVALPLTDTILLNFEARDDSSNSGVKLLHVSVEIGEYHKAVLTLGATPVLTSDQPWVVGVLAGISEAWTVIPGITDDFSKLRGILQQHVPPLQDDVENLRISDDI